MILNKNLYNPYIRVSDSTPRVMTDVIIALIPAIIMSYLAYGFFPIMVIMIAIGSAVLAEYLFSYIFFRDTKSVADGSAVITGILMAFTTGPFTPLYVVAFGAAAGVIFGKLMWGGLGRNRFNPALVGREFMTIFFPAIMLSGAIWQDSSLKNVESINIFNNEFYNGIFYEVSGAIGEYSPFFLIVGGLFLLYRHRISWHIPFGMLTAFAILLFFVSDTIAQFSFGGLFLGAIYMATDMPTSTSTNWGKVYYGVMIGVVCVLCLTNGADKGYFSYSILIMNGFVRPLNWIFRPRVWGNDWDWFNRAWQLLVITAAIFVVSFIVIWLDNNDWIMYPVLGFIAYTIIRFVMNRMKRV